MDQSSRAARQQSCYRCGVHRAHAQQPTVTTARGWMCGYCVMQMTLIADYSTVMREAEAAAAAAAAPRRVIVTEEPPPPRALQQELPRPLLPAVVEALSPREAKVHRALVNGPRTRQDIERQTGLPSTTVRSCLTSLELRGMLRKHGSGTKEEPYTYGYAQTGP